MGHLKRTLVYAFSCLAFLWLLIDPLSLFGLSEKLQKLGIWGYLSLILISILFGIFIHVGRILLKLDGFQDPNKLIVFKTSNQTTELRATSKGLELFLFDYKDKSNKGLKWLLPVEALPEILDKDEIYVRLSTKQAERGLFDIGTKRDWYYSTQIFVTPRQLHQEIKELLNRSIQLSSLEKKRN